MNDLHTRARLVELFALEAAGDLAPDEQTELDRLCGLAPHQSAEAERLLAALELSVTDDLLDEPLPAGPEPMPNRLRERLLEQAGAHFDRGAPPATGTTHRAVVARIGPSRWMGRIPWLVAAASIALAAWAWLPSIKPVAPMSQRAIIGSAKDAVTLKFKAGVAEYASAQAEVVWSDTLQKGYLKLSGFKTNSPSQKQYQLWIVDSKRDKRPVDGGVFDVDSPEAIVLISSKLDVQRPEAFAITLEKPGGVVVSDGPMLMIASRS